MERRLMSSNVDMTSDSLTGFPFGWKREESVRSSGLSAGRVDVYYINPEGKRFWTKPQLIRYFGETVDLSTFDFHSGRFVTPLPGTIKRSKIGEYGTPLKQDPSLQPPIRQTASIFKQPVTIVKTQKSRVKMDFKHGLQESPRQLFWEKRLQGLRASDCSGAVFTACDLPPGMSAAGPEIDAETVLHSIATALHLATHPITGQSCTKEDIQSNPTLYINPDQPLIHDIVVSEDDVRVQQDRVSLARKQLQEALLLFYPESIPRTDYERDSCSSPELMRPTVSLENDGHILPHYPHPLPHPQEGCGENPQKKIKLNPPQRMRIGEQRFD